MTFGINASLTMCIFIGICLLKLIKNTNEKLNDMSCTGVISSSLIKKKGLMKQINKNETFSVFPNKKFPCYKLVGSPVSVG